MSCYNSVKLPTQKKEEKTMRYAAGGDMVFIRLSDGEDLHRSISVACEEYGIDSAVVLSGLGMIRNVTFGWYTGSEYIQETIQGPFELSALSGNISYRGNSIYPHLHAVFNGRDHAAISGHILGASCDHNLEIALLPMQSLRLRRENDGWFEAIVPEKR